MRRGRSWIGYIWRRTIVRGRALARDDRAATAIEFAILAPVFFAFIFAILETAVVFLAGQILDSAVQDSGRLIRTGRAQAAAFTAADYRAAICPRLFGMLNCNDPDRLRIRVSVIPDFAAANPPAPMTCLPDGTCTWNVVDTFVPGTNSSVVMVEAYYRWPTIVNFKVNEVSFGLATMADGTRMLAAVRVFQNEP